MRTAEDILDDYLRLSRTGSVEQGLERNFATDVIVLIGNGVFHGFAGIRILADKLAREMPNPRFTYKSRVVAGRIALLEWSGRGDGGTRVEDGSDSFVIEDGKIRAQTIHYTVRTGQENEEQSR